MVISTDIHNFQQHDEELQGTDALITI